MINMNLEASKEFLQLRLIKKFTEQKQQQQQKNYKETKTTNFEIKCKFFSMEHKWKKMMGHGKIYLNSGIFFFLCIRCYKRNNRVEATEPPIENTEIYATNTPTETREKLLNGIFFTCRLIQRGIFNT